MKIVEINTCDYGSTGKIMKQIAYTAENNGHSCWIAIPKGRHNRHSDYEKTIWIGSQFSEDLHLLLGRITGLQGCFSIAATLSFLKKIEEIKPDIIHLHNLHNSYINLPLLFSFIRRNNIKVVWTLHDCWAFTGHCPYFTAKKCYKWKTGCYECPSYKEYPSSYVDRSKWMWRKKRDWFCSIKDMMIVTPSQWLENLVKESFLSNFPTRVINNGIDLTIFKKSPSDFRKINGLEDKIIILGVAFDWGYRKGLDIFIELSKVLDPQYQIVLVGTNDEIDKQLPENIISIHRTANQRELAELYSCADVLLNPTREDNYPTVNMESIACGTPVITFNTGGSPEMILNDECGRVLSSENIDDIIKAIKEVLCYQDTDCSKYAKHFDKDTKFNEYIKLYEEINENTICI